MSERQASYDDQLPWLQPVEDEDAPTGISARKMLAWVIIVLLGAALIAGSSFLIGRGDAPDGAAPELIKAEPGPYKVKPDDPGGLDVAGESETAFQTSAGEDHDAQLANPDGTAPPPPKPAAEEEPEPAPSAQPPSEAPAVSGGGGAVIQLGAFRNNAQAERAWAALSARFPAVAGLNKMIVPFSGGVRLRASGASARQACDAVRAGGENCFIAR